MTARIIDGRVVAAEVKAETAMAAARHTARTGQPPGLATILVGDDPASHVYVANKRKSANQCGIADFHRHLDSDATHAQVATVLSDLAVDPRVSGILLQLPLPVHLDPAALIELIPPDKDVDGLTTLSQGLLARGRNGLRPCTPLGVMRLLADAGVDLDGSDAVVIGRSELVGRPMAQLLLQANASVTIAHSRTRDLAAIAQRADVVVAAAGVRGLIGAKHIREGATVIDVGIHRTELGLVGDVRSDEVETVAGALTRVPGGVGPMTIAMLLSNTVVAAERQIEVRASLHEGPRR